MPALTTKLFNATTTSLSASGNSNKVIIVGGRVSGLAGLAGATESNALYKVLEALSDEGYSLYPTGSAYPEDPTLVLTNVAVTGVSGNSADVRLRFETPTGAPGTALIYEVDSCLQAVQRDRYPGGIPTIGGNPIWVAWEGKATSGGPLDPISPRIPMDTAPFAYQRPIIRVAATIVRPGALDDATAIQCANSIGVVNDAPWMGRTAGCWLMSNYRSSTSRFAGTVSIRAEAISRKGEDYRVLEVLRSRTTGRIAAVDPSKISAALAADYAFGPVGGFGLFDPGVDGFECFGPYEMVDFTSLWSVLIE